MTVDVNIRPYDEQEIEEALQVMEESPMNERIDVSALELETNPFEWGAETNDAEEFFREVSGASTRVGPRTGVGNGGEVGELHLEADEAAYDHVDTMVGILEDHGYDVPEIRFSEGMGIQRLGKIGGGTGAEDVPDYIDNFENGQHQIIITAEKDGERTAVKYNTDGYAVIEKGQLIHPEEKEFWRADRELGFEFSEELRDTDIPVEWRTGTRQNLDYTDREVEYDNGSVSPEGRPAPLPTSVTGGNDYDTAQFLRGTQEPWLATSITSGNDYDTAQRSYQVDGEEFTGTTLEPRFQDKSYFQRLRELI